MCVTSNVNKKYATYFLFFSTNKNCTATLTSIEYYISQIHAYKTLETNKKTLQ